jgi:hypothetical protein
MASVVRMEDERPGLPTTEEALRTEGFTPLDFEFREVDLQLSFGSACEWTTKGDVPSGPGLYAFAVEAREELQVLYVGLTEELWMITKGCTPDGKARLGQRYGRPRYAGVTRQRVNALIAQHLRRGRRVRHWIRPLENVLANPTDMRHLLERTEEELISRWKLRQLGWNPR